MEIIFKGGMIEMKCEECKTTIEKGDCILCINGKNYCSDCERNNCMIYEGDEK